ncbi:hypothetical protein ScPMuIL_015457 [Solemya velum]
MFNTGIISIVFVLTFLIALDVSWSLSPSSCKQAYTRCTGSRIPSAECKLKLHFCLMSYCAEYANMSTKRPQSTAVRLVTCYLKYGVPMDMWVS